MKKKKIIAHLISMFPSNCVRVILYRLIMKYEISDSYIGFGTVIAVDKAIIKNSSVGRSNCFYGPMSVMIKDGCCIGNHNQFMCGSWVEERSFSDQKYARLLEINEKVLITSDHYFDVAGNISIGQGTWVAGRGSQFWTHGVGVSDRDIHIGESCYLGSAVRFAPGVLIGNKTLVALGSVVTKKFGVNNVLLGGVPATILKENYIW